MGMIVVEVMDSKRPLDPMFWLNYCAIQAGYGADNFREVVAGIAEEDGVKESVGKEVAAALAGDFGTKVTGEWWFPILAALFQTQGVTNGKG